MPINLPPLTTAADQQDAMLEAMACFYGQGVMFFAKELRHPEYPRCGIISGLSKRPGRACLHVYMSPEWDLNRGLTNAHEVVEVWHDIPVLERHDEVPLNEPAWAVACFTNPV